MFFAIVFVASGISASPLCDAASAMVLSADLHLAAWNRQLEVLTPGNCTQMYQFLYASHARVLEGLETELQTMVSGNFSEVTGVAATAGASSLLSAQLHGISYLSTNFRSCFEADRDLEVMGFVLLRRAKTLVS